MVTRNLPHGTWRPGRRRANDVDQAAIERLLTGDHAVRSSIVDRAAALDIADRHGVSARDVAIRLGCSIRTVTRRRAVRRRAPVTPPTARGGSAT